MEQRRPERVGAKDLAETQRNVVACVTTAAEMVTAATIEPTVMDIMTLRTAARPGLMCRAASAMVSAQIGAKRPGFLAGMGRPSFRNL